MTGDSNWSKDANWQTTHWSVVLSAKGGPDLQPEGDWHESLETLCQTYWYPLYAYLRRKGYSADDAADLTQSFFAALIEKDYLKAVDPQRGRFRWFLMHAANAFAAKWQEARLAQKRGGDRKFFSLNFREGESRYQNEPVDGWNPERLFDRRWAITIIQSALAQLATTYEQTGKKRLFDGLKVFLGAGGEPPKYHEVAEQLDLSETAVKVAIHRLRERYRDTIRQLVADTMAPDGDLDAEINDLMDAL